MPQTFQVLRCFQCLVFQVHPTNKANKWKCKICGEKQSIKRFYGLGTGKECRLHVQKLNGIQGEINNAKLNSGDSDESANSPNSIEQAETGSTSEEQNESLPKAINNKSKWADYLDKTEENEQNMSGQAINLDETEVVLELPKKRPRKNKHVFQTPVPFSSESKNLPLKRVNSNSIKDKSVESEQCNAFITNWCHTQVTDPPVKMKEVLLPSVSNSKWAQYVEETENINNEDASINDLHVFGSSDDHPKCFSLFDNDDNLDAVLDF